jgi:hypothetical protein
MISQTLQDWKCSSGANLDEARSPLLEARSASASPRVCAFQPSTRTKPRRSMAPLPPSPLTPSPKRQPARPSTKLRSKSPKTPSPPPASSASPACPSKPASPPRAATSSATASNHSRIQCHARSGSEAGAAQAIYHTKFFLCGKAERIPIRAKTRVRYTRFRKQGTTALAFRSLQFTGKYVFCR